MITMIEASLWHDTYTYVVHYFHASRSVHPCEMFPTFQPPRCEKDYLNFLQHLMDLRENVYRAPLTFPHTLQVVDQCTDPYPPRGRTEISAPPKVPQHHQPKKRMRIFPELSSPEEMQVVIERGLQTGCEKWSQVYAGRLTVRARTCDVVVKLYQECMFPEPSSVNFYGSEGIFEGDWPSGTELAQREAWAYNLLQQYQGSTVPYSYGFYTFRLRSEKITGFVMEKLDGLTVEEFFALNDHRRQVKLLLAEALAWSIHGLHCAGVVHSDIRRSNMRIRTDNGADLIYVTLFDFSNAAGKFNSLNRLTFGRDAGCITEVAIGDDDDSVEAWKVRSQVMQPTWAEMFRVDGNIYF